MLGDLLKTGSGAILGFIMGLIAEPMKGWIETRLAIREAEKLLFQEINLLTKQSLYLLPAHENPAIFKNEPYAEFNFRLERYAHLKQDQPKILMKVSGYEELRSFFEAFTKASNRVVKANDAGTLLFPFVALKEYVEKRRLPSSFKKPLKPGPFKTLIERIEFDR